ncbi:MAG TPA: hypothetical protein PLQ20_01465 [Candidatus Paceibacterota bacterium]|nr:hypothetical protein [Candidatus Paceibacterota bacterium]
MKWIAIAGGWRKTNDQVDREVRSEIKKIFSDGNGIISGGALGVDYIALDEALKNDQEALRIKIFIPSTFEIYKNHFLSRASEGVITIKQASDLIEQIAKLKSINPGALIEGPDKILNQESYFRRITEIIKNSDELIAFHINKTEGTQDTIEKAAIKNIPIKVFSYTL